MVQERFGYQGIDAHVDLIDKIFTELAAAVVISHRKLPPPPLAFSPNDTSNGFVLHTGLSSIFSFSIRAGVCLMHSQARRGMLVVEVIP